MYSLLRPATRSVLQTSRVGFSAKRFPGQFRTLLTTKYTADHESVIFDDSTGIGTITITEYAQASLGDVVFVELPADGTEVSQGDQIGAVESVKAASDIYAPVSGTIDSINATLSSQPNLLNKSPEDLGWLCKIRLTDPSEMDSLLSKEDYEAKIPH